MSGKNVVTKKDKERALAAKLEKGVQLGVKAPPYFDKEYVYEIAQAGSKLVRANLHNSPKVKKHWTIEELALLIEMKVVRIIDSV
jgi:hypothetical protein